MEEIWNHSVKWAVYDLVGSISIDELVSNAQLVESWRRLERLVKQL